MEEEIAIKDRLDCFIDQLERDIKRGDESVADFIEGVQSDFGTGPSHRFMERLGWGGGTIERAARAHVAFYLLQKIEAALSAGQSAEEVAENALQEARLHAFRAYTMSNSTSNASNLVDMKIKCASVGLYKVAHGLLEQET